MKFGLRLLKTLFIQKYIQVKNKNKIYQGDFLLEKQKLQSKLVILVRVSFIQG